MTEINTLSRVREMLSGVSLTVRSWSPTRAGRPHEEDLASDALQARSSGRIRVRKEVIDTGHYAWKALTKVKNAVRAWWDYNTLPYVVSGQRLFLRVHRDDIWSKVAEFNGEIQRKAAALDACRDELLHEARHALGQAFDSTLYPEKWSEAFGLEIREHSIEPPSYLRYSNAEEYQREMERTMTDLGASMKRFESQCMSQMADAASRLSANLTDGNRVMSGNVDAFQRVFARVAQMQFDGTQIFKSALAEAQDILDGVKADELRTNRELRSETRTRLQQLMARFGQLQQAVAEKYQEAIPA